MVAGMPVAATEILAVLAVASAPCLGVPETAGWVEGIACRRLHDARRASRGRGCHGLKHTRHKVCLLHSPAGVQAPLCASARGRQINGERVPGKEWL